MDSSSQEAADNHHASSPKESKKRKQLLSSSNEREKHYYKGIRIQPCICLHGQKCRDAFKAFVDAGDPKRCGYFYVPSTTLQKNQAPLVTKQRQSIYNCLWSSGCTPPKPTHNQYIAFHHFHPAILQDDNGGPVKEVDFDTAKRIRLSKSDMKDASRNVYFPAPNYPHAEWERDYLSSIQAMRPISDFILDSDSSVDLDDGKGDDADSSHEFQLRPSPFVRNVQSTYRFVKAHPLEASIEIVKLQEELDRTDQMLRQANVRAHLLAAQLEEKKQKLEVSIQLQKELELCGGLTRFTATSLEWHKKNSTGSDPRKTFAHHLWGLGSFQHMTVYVTEVFFPKVDAKVGKRPSDPFTDFEKILICVMRIRRNYDQETLTKYWGKQSHTTLTDVFQKWMPELSRVGNYMSILDLDLNIDYLSAEDARRLGVDHSSLAPLAAASYIDISVPQVYRKQGYEKVGALVDGKVFMTDTVRVSSAASRMLYADKIDNSGGLVMTWSTPTGLVFEHTGLYFARCPETRLIELWGTVDPEQIRFAMER